MRAVFVVVVGVVDKVVVLLGVPGPDVDVNVASTVPAVAAVVADCEAV